MFETTHAVSFGDCDPAGILFYPNHFRMMDATFQLWLRSRGLDQALLRVRLEAVGTGLLGAEATFRAPVRDGDGLRHELSVTAWERRVLRLRYRGFVGERLAVEGSEARGLFVRSGDGLALAELALLRALLEEPPGARPSAAGAAPGGRGGA